METKPQASSIFTKFMIGVIGFSSFMISVYYIKYWYLYFLQIIGHWEYVVLLFIIAAIIFGISTIIIYTYRFQIIKRITPKKDGDDKYNKISYDRSDCVRFYDEIADVYDIDNSKEIWVTHRAVARIVNTYSKKHAKISVLDIGGGTGTLMFDMLSLNEKLHWTYVDNSKNMCSIFKQKCEEQGLKVEIKNISFDSILSQSQLSYDIIILSFLFSSLPLIPDLSRLFNLLRPGGMIVFADADQAYSRRLPYKVLKGGTEHTLLTKPFKHSDISLAFIKVNFKFITSDVIKKQDGETYSHIIVFQK